MSVIVPVCKHNVNSTLRPSDFNEVVASGYRPGAVRIGLDDVVLSVSKPSFKLAESISPQALSAWDPRLLSSVKHLTLIISGTRGVYPALLADGTVDRRLNGLTFRVGLTSGYKPNRELVLQLTRSFALQEDGMEDPLEPAFNALSDDENNVILDSVISHQQDEDVPEESFDFSLSSSLEALMNDRFVDLLQIRLRYSFGWAAAEALLSEVHRSQRKSEDVFEDCITVRTNGSS